MINFVTKINITLSPLLQTYFENIQKAELPSISFIEVTSMINDGGEQTEEDYLRQKEEEKEPLSAQSAKSGGVSDANPQRLLSGLT